MFVIIRAESSFFLQLLRVLPSHNVIPSFNCVFVIHTRFRDTHTKDNKLKITAEGKHLLGSLALVYKCCARIATTTHLRFNAYACRDNAIRA